MITNLLTCYLLFSIYKSAISPDSFKWPDVDLLCHLAPGFFGRLNKRQRIEGGLERVFSSYLSSVVGQNTLFPYLSGISKTKITIIV